MRFKEMIHHLWSSHRGSLILLSALVLLNAALSVVIGQYLNPKVSDRESSFLERQAAVRKLLHNQSAAAQAPEQLYVLGSQDLSKFYESVPRYKDFTGLIEELLVLSNDSGLNIARISYDSEALKESSLLKLSLNFNVLGNYGNIKKFVHSLEQSPRLLAIRKISLQGENGQSVNLRLSLETYFKTGGQES